MVVRSLVTLLIGVLLLSCASSGGGKEPTPSPSQANQPTPPSKQASPQQPTAPTSQPSPTPAATPSAQPVAPFTPTATSSPAQPTVPPEAEQPVRLARQDVAHKLGVSIDEVRVVKISPVQWPDASLGCPEPGKVYAQVIISGYRLLLEAHNATYEYHTDTDGHVVQCPKR